MPRTRPPYPPEFRRQAVELVRSGTPLKQVAEWADNYRRFWDASYKRLDEYLKQMQQKEKSDEHDR